MRKYKYTKGNEGHFYGAPEEAIMLVIDNNKRKYFVEISPTPGARYWGVYGGSGIWGDGVYRSQFLCIAKRYIVDVEEQGLTECGGRNHEPSIIGASLREIDGTEPVTYPGVDALITERGTRYGKFKDGAEIMQSLKDTMRDVDGWNNLTASQKEALDMIQHKIGRILNGDPTYDDSWKDIAGYATLIVNELNGEAK